jgi:hypothetical protein
MRYWILAAGAIAAGTVLGFVWPVMADPLPMDNPVNLNGIEAVCTGIGSAQDNPAWKAYPIRVEFSNGGAQYMAGAHLTLSGAGKQIASFDCSGSWVLFKLPKGSYKISATILDQANLGEHSATFSPPASGQKRVIIQFPKPPNQ